MVNKEKIYYTIIGITFVLLYIIGSIVLDFYFFPRRQAIYYNEGLWAFIHYELMELGTIRAIFTKW